MSDAMSFEGWEFWTWFKGNWNTIKEVGKVVVPGWLAMLATARPELVVAITLVGKGLLDAVEYFVKKQ